MESLSSPSAVPASLLQSIRDPLFVVRNGRIISFANQAARTWIREVIGSAFSDAPIPAAQLRDALPTEAASNFVDLHRRVRTADSAASTEVKVDLRQRGDNRKTIWFDVHAYPHDGGVTFLMHDITERKQAEQEESWRLHLLEQTQKLAGGWSIDLRRNEAGVTKQVYEIYEHPADLPLSVETSLSYYTEDAQRKLRNALAACERDGTGYDLEIPIVTRKGTKKWVRTIGVPYIEDGEVVRIAGALQDVTKRVRHEAALREHDRRHEMAIMGANLGTWDVDYATRENIVNEQWAKMLGFTLDEVGSSLDFFESRIHPDDLPKLLKAFEEHVRGERDLLDCEIRVRAKDGTWRWILDRGRVIERNADGSPSRAVGTHLDITERKMAEKALQKSETRFRALVEASAQIVWTAEPDGKVREDSASWRAFTGQSFAEYTGRGWLGAVHPADRSDLYAAWTEAVTAVETFTAEYRAFHQPSSSYRWLRVRGVPLRDELGHLRGWIGMDIDIHAQKEREVALRRSKIALEQAQALSRTGNGVLNMETQTFTLSQEAGVLLDLDPDIEHSFSALLEIVHPEDRDLVAHEFERVAKGHEHDDEFRIFPGDDRERMRWIRGRGQPDIDPDGSVRRVLSTISDITEEKKRRDELVRAKEVAEEANRLKSAFLANMSHEIRTPLTSIIGFAEVLDDEDLTPSAKSFVRHIHRSSNRLYDTLTSVIDLSQLEAGARDIAEETVDLRKVVASVIDDFSGQAQGGSVELTSTLDLSPFPVRADRQSISSIVTNLVSNAIKFTDPDGTVDVELRRVANEDGRPESVLVVADSGIGIEEAFLKKIFEPFQQESMGSGRRFEGSGLGLAITRHYVDLLGGNIHVDSTKGVGTRITVRLPLTP